MLIIVIIHDRARTRRGK